MSEYVVVQHKDTLNYYVCRRENVHPTDEKIIRELSPTESPFSFGVKTKIDLGDTPSPKSPTPAKSKETA